jgi:hypothetical protein
VLIAERRRYPLRALACDAASSSEGYVAADNPKIRKSTPAPGCIWFAALTVAGVDVASASYDYPEGWQILTRVEFTWAFFATSRVLLLVLPAAAENRFRLYSMLPHR